jgi:hypothetical protein
MATLIRSRETDPQKKVGFLGPPGKIDREQSVAMQILTHTGMKCKFNNRNAMQAGSRVFKFVGNFVLLCYI